MSLQAPPQLHNTQAVTFDATLGWVTPTENMVVKQSALDKIAPIVFVGVATWMTAGAFGIAGGAGVTAGAGIGAAGGVVGAMTAGAAFGAIGGFYGGLIGEGRIDPKAMFRGALTGAVTAGVVRAAGLNEMGVTRELNRQGQSVITGIDYTQRALAVTGQATLQGALTAITGGEFKDGFTAGLAQGLGTEIGRGLELKITEMQAGNTPISATEAGALRQFARVAQSAVSLLGNPDDPGHAFAMTFVNGLVGDVQGGLDARSLQGQGPWSDAGYRNGSDIESDAYNPASAYDYRNGSDMASEHAEQLRRNEAWSAQSDAITARRGSEVGVQGNEPNVAQTNAASPANATPAINGAVDHGTSPTQTVVIIGARPPALRPPDVTGAERFVSEPGWTALAAYLRANLAEVVKRRDQGPSAGRPLFLHTYSTPTVWRQGTLGASDGWLFKAFMTFGIAPADQQAIADLLFHRLRQLMLSVDQGSLMGDALPQVHVFDSASQVTLLPPDPQATSSSGDWVNEIHPSRSGYRKLGAAFGSFIDEVLSRYPG